MQGGLSNDPEVLIITLHKSSINYRQCFTYESVSNDTQTACFCSELGYGKHREARNIKHLESSINRLYSENVNLKAWFICWLPFSG